MITVGELGEKRIIREVVYPIVAEGGHPLIGNDAACLSFASHDRVVITTDKVPTDLVGYRAGFMSDLELGRYIVEVNISDLCATGAQPQGFLVNIAVPRDFPLSKFRDIYRGIGHRCREFDIPIVGGDTKFSETPVFVGIAVGSMAPSRHVLERSGAKPGDLVFVTGEVGSFAAGLKVFLNQDLRNRISEEDFEFVREAVCRPTCRFDIADALARSGIVSSCMDISDGLGQSLRELAEASMSSFIVDFGEIPIHGVVSRVADASTMELTELVFGPGLDLELVGTMEDTLQAQELLNECGLVLIGKVVAGPSQVYYTDAGKTSVMGWGYDQLLTDLNVHFKMPADQNST